MQAKCSDVSFAPTIFMPDQLVPKGKHRTQGVFFALSLSFGSPFFPAVHKFSFNRDWQHLLFQSSTIWNALQPLVLNGSCLTIGNPHYSCGRGKKPLKRRKFGRSTSIEWDAKRNDPLWKGKGIYPIIASLLIFEWPAWVPLLKNVLFS